MSDYIDDVIVSAELSSAQKKIHPGEYSVTLHSARGELTHRVQMRTGYEGRPTTGQFVYYFATRIQLVAMCDDFLQWVDETGKSASDPTDLAEYKLLVAELDAFKQVLGDGAFKSLMASLSVDQAITRAKSSL